MRNDMGKERGGRSHVDDVGIAFETGHQGGLHDGCFVVVPLLAFPVTGVFAGKHLRSLTVVRIIAQTVTQEPLMAKVR